MSDGASVDKKRRIVADDDEEMQEAPVGTPAPAPLVGTAAEQFSPELLKM